MPVIWLIDAYRAGERNQVRALVDELGWPCETKRLEYRKHVVLPHVLGLATLRGITPASAAALKPPWPDLVISSGVRNEPVCRWIRAASGGHTRYVHVGRPWGPLAGFDLVITTPQYRVPRRPNVLNNLLTLHSVTPRRLEAAREQWAASFADLPRPHCGDHRRQQRPVYLWPAGGNPVGPPGVHSRSPERWLPAGIHQLTHFRGSHSGPAGQHRRAPFFLSMATR